MRDLDLVLSYLTGRRLTGRDIYTALNMPKATYFSQRDAGRLHQPVNLLKLARAFEVNPVSLLVEYGYLTDDDIIRYRSNLAQHPGPSGAHSTVGPTSITLADLDDITATLPGPENPPTGSAPQKIVELVVKLPAAGADASSAVEQLRQALEKLALQEPQPN